MQERRQKCQKIGRTKNISRYGGLVSHYLQLEQCTGKVSTKAQVVQTVLSQSHHNKLLKFIPLLYSLFTYLPQPQSVVVKKVDLSTSPGFECWLYHYVNLGQITSWFLYLHNGYYMITTLNPCQKVPAILESLKNISCTLLLSSQLIVRTNNYGLDTIQGSKDSRVNGKILFFNTEVRHVISDCLLKWPS